MEISKFIVGVLTIAIGLWVAGHLESAIASIGRGATIALKEHQEFKIGTWNRRIGK